MRLPISTAFILFAPCALGSCAPPQADIAAQAEAVRTRSRGVAAAEHSKNVDQALIFWAEDAIMQPDRAAVVRGKAEIADNYRAFFESDQLKEFSSTSSYIEVSTTGDLAYEYGVNRVVLAGPSGDLLDIGKYLAVWKKIHGEWFIAALSFTSDTPAPISVGE